MFNLKEFNNLSDYESFKVSNEYIEPHVALIIDNNSLKYKRYKLNEIIAGYDNRNSNSNYSNYILSDSFDITQIDKMYMNGEEIPPMHNPIYINNPVKYVMKNTFNNCYYMFSNCSKLTSLDVSSFNTSNVTDMQYMFYNCNKLTSLDLSSFDTSKVNNMSNMFNGCDSLTSLDVSSFDTSNVTNMASMFDGCYLLTSLNVSLFNTSNVTDMNRMFEECYELTSLDLSSFDTSNVTDMNSMFCACGFTSLDLSSFNTSNVTDMQYMFSGCTSLTSLDVSSFNTSNVTNMNTMFYNCNKITSLDLSSFDISNVTYMNCMFEECYSLTNLNPFYNWKEGDIDLSYSPITPLAVHQLIERSMSASDGTEARTLSLSSTTKTEWENSEYHEQDLTLLPLKNITIM